MKDERVYLLHAIEAIDAIVRYTADGERAFFSDAKTQDAVIRNIEIIGQAVKGISDATRAPDPEVPWRRIAGMRGPEPKERDCETRNDGTPPLEKKLLNCFPPVTLALLGECSSADCMPLTTRSSVASVCAVLEETPACREKRERSLRSSIEPGAAQGVSSLVGWLSGCV